MKTDRDILVEFGLELLNGGRDPSVVKMNQKDIEEQAERFLNRAFSAELPSSSAPTFAAFGKTKNVIKARE